MMKVALVRVRVSREVHQRIFIGNNLTHDSVINFLFRRENQGLESDFNVYDAVEISVEICTPIEKGA